MQVQAWHDLRLPSILAGLFDRSVLKRSSAHLASTHERALARSADAGSGNTKLPLDNLQQVRDVAQVQRCPRLEDTSVTFRDSLSAEIDATAVTKKSLFVQSVWSTSVLCQDGGLSVTAELTLPDVSCRIQMLRNRVFL